jgi:hypothetical protein
MSGPDDDARDPGWIARAARKLRSPRGPDLDGDAPGLARRLLRRAADQVTRRADPQAALDRALHLISDPRVASALQQSLSALGNRGMEAAFTQQPHARLLFDFAEWCDQRASRGAVMGALMRDTLSPEGAFYHLYQPLMALGAVKDPLAALAAQPPEARLLEALHEAQRGALRTLCALAALALPDAPASPHDADAEALAAHFAALPLPPRFLVLGELALGRGADQGEDASAPTPSQAPSPAPTGALARAQRWLPARALPPGLRFVIGPWLWFLQLYLTRNMVDALPEMMGRVRDELAQEQARADHEADGPTIEMGPGRDQR